MRLTTILPRALLALSLAACAPPRQNPRPLALDLLTEEQLEATRVTNLYEAIRQARPSFLYERGPISLQSSRAQAPVVYVDDVPLGTVEVLKTMLVGDVAQVRRISASEATTRWGTGHPGGVVYVTTKGSRARPQQH